MINWIARVLGLAACVALGFFVYRHSASLAKPTTKPPAIEPVSVEITRIERRPIEERVDLVGSLEAAATVDVRPRSRGYIAMLPFDVGDFVEKGTTVVTLEDEDAKELVSRSEAALAVARAQRVAQKSKVDLAHSDSRRILQLAERGVVTAQQIDEVQGRLDVAEAELTLEDARILQAEHDLERSRLAREETRLTVPTSGFVAERLAEVGDLADPALPILKLVDLSTVRTVVHVLERDYERVRLDQHATIRVDAFPHGEFTGRVIRKSPIIDPATRMAAVHIEIPNPGALLKPGMHARATIRYGATREADVVPLASLIEQGDRPALFVITGDPPTSKLQEVQTGVIDGDMVEIIAGLGPQDRIVTLGSRMLLSGQPVIPVDAPPIARTAIGHAED